MANFFELVGQTILGTKQNSGGLLWLRTAEHDYHFVHHQSCCESVGLERIDGSLEDLVGGKVVFAEEDSNTGHPGWWKPDYNPESHTWTIFKIRTKEGAEVTLWFLGTSNGYYGESVQFESDKDSRI